MRRRLAAFALSAMSLLASSAAAQEVQPPPAKGEIVTELDEAVWHVFQAKNGDYWFGSREAGAYRYDGKTLVRFTTKDGLGSDHVSGFQEDRAGNILIGNDGLLKFDGRAFTPVRVATNSDVTDWKLRADDLWFAGPKNTGQAYRYDGEALHPLAFPTTKDGDDHYREVPRDKYPNAKYSPYDVFSIFKDSKGHVWFGTAILGACRYDGKSFTWIPEGELRNGSFGTRAIVEDEQGKFWFCNPLHRYAVASRGSSGQAFRRLTGIPSKGDPRKAPFSGIMSSALGPDGALWMATYGEGVWRHHGKTTTHYPVTEGGEQVNLFSILVDDDGVPWLGTQTSGVYKFNGKSFERFRPASASRSPDAEWREAGR